MIVEMVLAGVLPPLVVATVLFAATWLRTPRSPDAGDPSPAPWAAPLAIGLGTAAAAFALNGAPRLAWSVELKHGIFYGALVTGILGAAVAARRSTVALALAFLVTSALAPVYLLDFVRQYQWEAESAWTWTAALGAVLLVTCVAMEGLARRRPGPSLPFAWMVMGCASAGAIHLSGSASIAQLEGAWTAVLGVAWVAAWLRPAGSLARGAIAPLAFLHTACVWGGHFASELSELPAVLLLVAPLAPWIAELPGPWARSERARAVTRIVLALAPAAIAAGLEWAALESDPYAGY